MDSKINKIWLTNRLSQVFEDNSFLTIIDEEEYMVEVDCVGFSITKVILRITNLTKSKSCLLVVSDCDKVFYKFDSYSYGGLEMSIPAIDMLDKVYSLSKEYMIKYRDKLTKEIKTYK